MSADHSSKSTLPESQPIETRIVLRPYASALPLGLLSFAVGMVLVSGIALGWLTGRDVATAGLFMVAFVAPLQAISAVFAFLSRDVGAATALGLFSTSWIATGLDHVLSPPTATSTAVGMFLLAFALVLTAPAAAAEPVRPLFAIMLAVSVTRAAVGGIYQLTATTPWSDAEGILALALAAIAVYNGSALLLEDARQHPVLPTWRRGPARDAFYGSISDQTIRNPHEAGVREQL